MKQRLNSHKEIETETPLTASAKESLLPDRDFESMEALLRADSMATAVPPHVHERLMRSVAQEKKSLPWWKRWFQ